MENCTIRGFLTYGFILIVVLVNCNPRTVRFLTPLSYIDQSKGVADTQYQRDPTLGFDEKFRSCWNNDRLAKLHEHDPTRRASYEQHFSTSALWRLTEIPIPDFFTVSGPSVKLILNEQRTGLIAMSLWNNTFTYNKETNPLCISQCIDPPAVLPPTARSLTGKYVVFTAYMWGHYGHSTHDSLPWLAYVKEMTSHDPTIKYILLDYRRAKDIITTLDPHFAAHRVVWIKLGELTEINGSVITLHDMPTTRNNNPRFMDFLRLWSIKGRNRQSARNKIIYYDRRNPLDTKTARLIHPDIEREMITRIKDGMKKHGRTEEFVVYNGLHPNGGRLSSLEQFVLFRDATTVIGPHGSGMSGNMLWTNPMPKDCDDRVKVLELFGGNDTAKETSPNVVGTIVTHWYWMRAWPFDYHHMMFAPGSTRTAMIFDLDTFSEALDSMWGPNADP